MIPFAKCAACPDVSCQLAAAPLRKAAQAWRFIGGNRRNLRLTGQGKIVATIPVRKRGEAL
jgi:hypothetical protein